MTMDSQDLSKVFAVLAPDMSLHTEAVRSSLYQDIDATYDGFQGHALIACHHFTGDWDSWEIHPAGDELVVLVSGSASFVLWKDGAEESVSLSAAGAFMVVPRGTWHTARLSEPTSILFITPGEGTQHAARPS